MASHLKLGQVIQSNWRLQSVLAADYRRSPSKSSSSGYYASAPILLCNWIRNKPIYDASFRLLVRFSSCSRPTLAYHGQLFDGCLQPPSRQRADSIQYCFLLLFLLLSTVPAFVCAARRYVDGQSRHLNLNYWPLFCTSPSQTDPSLQQTHTHTHCLNVNVGG